MTSNNVRFTGLRISLKVRSSWNIYCFISNIENSQTWWKFDLAELSEDKEEGGKRHLLIKIYKLFVAQKF